MAKKVISFKWEWIGKALLNAELNMDSEGELIPIVFTVKVSKDGEEPWENVKKVISKDEYADLDLHVVHDIQTDMNSYSEDLKILKDQGTIKLLVDKTAKFYQVTHNCVVCSDEDQIAAKGEIVE